jgi:gentisate 1,2-dioxygenase
VASDRADSLPASPTFLRFALGRRFVGATHSLVASLQMLMPGEIAPAHRHSYSALRFMLSGSGAYTVVDGESVAMAVGDLVLTPNWKWHDHGHRDGAQPMVWLSICG